MQVTATDSGTNAQVEGSARHVAPLATGRRR
jgi:hypothetical protein